MKALTCEMCGSTNLIKEGGVFVCQSCGTKYSLEEAKKMMVEGTVDVKGTVKVDTSDELKNLYEIARRAKDANNSENAQKYYDLILMKDPKSWEASFFVVYYKAMSCKIKDIEMESRNITNIIPSVLSLIKSISEAEVQNDAISEVYLRCALIAKMLHGAAVSHYEGIDLQIKNNYTQECIDNCFSAFTILYVLGDEIEKQFGETYGMIAAKSYEKAIELHNATMRYIPSNLKEKNKQYIEEHALKANKYDSSYGIPKVDMESHGDGCLKNIFFFIIFLLALAGILIPILTKN